MAVGFQESDGTFPFQLYDALQKATELGLESVSWVQGGTRFMVHDRDLFMTEVLPKHFSGQSQFKSFQRQLNLYGFLRTKIGPLKGSFYHPCFIKDRRHLCHRITRPSKLLLDDNPSRCRGSSNKRKKAGVKEAPASSFLGNKDSKRSNLQAKRCLVFKSTIGIVSDGSMKKVAPNLSPSNTIEKTSKGYDVNKKLCNQGLSTSIFNEDTSGSICIENGRCPLSIARCRNTTCLHHDSSQQRPTPEPPSVPTSHPPPSSEKGANNKEETDAKGEADAIRPTSQDVAMESSNLDVLEDFQSVIIDHHVEELWESSGYTTSAETFSSFLLFLDDDDATMIMMAQDNAMSATQSNLPISAQQGDVIHHIADRDSSSIDGSNGAVMPQHERHRYYFHDSFNCPTENSDATGTGRWSISSCGSSTTPHFPTTSETNISWMADHSKLLGEFASQLVASIFSHEKTAVAMNQGRSSGVRSAPGINVFPHMTTSSPSSGDIALTIDDEIISIFGKDGSK